MRLPKRLLFFTILCTYQLHGDAPYFEKILLIINYNHAHYNSIPTIREIYTPYFPNIVFYGPEKHSDVFHLDHHKGYYSYLAIADAMQRFPHFDGYFFVHDDCIINPWWFTRLDPSHVWAAKFPFVPGGTDLGTPISIDQEKFHWCWWEGPWGRNACLAAHDEMPEYAKTMLACNWGERNVVGGHSDIAYVPQKYRKEFTQLALLFGKHKVFLEIAIPTLLSCLCPKEDWENLEGILSAKIQHYTFNKDYFHPVKLSQPENQYFVKALFSFVKTFRNKIEGEMFGIEIQ